MMKTLFLLFLSFTLPWQVNANEDAIWKKLANYQKVLIEQERVYKDVIKSYRLKTSFERPEQCPLTSTKYGALLTKIRSIRDGLSSQCTSKNAQAISQLSNNLRGMDTLYAGYKSGKDGQDLIRDDFGMYKPLPPLGPHSTKAEKDAYKEELLRREQKLDVDMSDSRVIRNTSSTLSIIADLAQMTECRDDMQKGGVLGMVSDIISESSDIGLLVPGPAGYLTAAAGRSLGAALKLISIFTRSTYDWSQEKNRTTFLDLNCSFFTLKMEMESVGILTVTSDHHMKEINQKSRSLVKLYRGMALLLNEHGVLTDSYRKDKKEELSEIMGKEAYRTLELLEKAKFLTHGKDPQSLKIEEKGNIIESLFDIHVELKSLFPKIDLGKYGKFELPQTIEKMDSIFKGIQNKDKIIPLFFKDKDAFNHLVRYFNEPVHWILDYLNNKENDALKKSGVKKLSAVLDDYDKLIKKMKNLTNSFEDRNHFLKNIQKGKLFNTEEGGTAILSNIIEHFKAVEKQIYGGQGYSFLKYITKESFDSMEKFKDRFSDFESMKKKVNEGTMGKVNLKLEGCSDAKNLILEWNRAFSLSKIGYDFVYTNNDLFITPKNKRRKYFGFIPAGRSHQKYILENAQGAVIAKSSIATGKILGAKIRNEDLGAIMMKVDRASIQVAEVEKFSDRYNCQMGKKLRIK
jgi:hypothetical protein